MGSLGPGFRPVTTRELGKGFGTYLNFECQAVKRLMDLETKGTGRVRLVERYSVTPIELLFRVLLE